MEMENKTLIAGLKRFNPNCEHITLSTIFYKMRIPGERFNVINYGSAGGGKSYSSIELIKELNLGTDIILDNNTTKRGLFEQLMNYPNHDFLLDECTAALRDKGTQDMVKLAMEGKPLNWIKKKSTEESPIFLGNFMLNVNHELETSVVDRCFVNKALMNKKMALDFVDYYVEKLENKEKEIDKVLLNYLKKLLSKEIKVVLSKEEMEYVKNFVKRQIELDDKNLDYSRRTIIRAISYFKRTKALFGKLDDEVKTFIEPYASTYIENSRPPTVIETLLGDAKIEKPELIRIIAENAGCSERTARRMVDDEIAKGTLKIFGKNVFLAMKDIVKL